MVLAALARAFSCPGSGAYKSVCEARSLPARGGESSIRDGSLANNERSEALAFLSLVGESFFELPQLLGYGSSAVCR